MPRPPKQRKPWPMKWIVLSIFIFIPLYTYLTLHYRRPGPAFQPYQDMHDRAEVYRLLKAGYQRVAIEASRPAEPVRSPGGATEAGPGGVPEELRKSLIDPPLLPLEVRGASAAPTASSAIDYTVSLTYTIPDNKRQLSGAHLYLRPGEIIIIADFERLSGALQARDRDGEAELEIPPGAIKPGTYRVRLVGERASREWDLTVR